MRTLWTGPRAFGRDLRGSRRGSTGQGRRRGGCGRRGGEGDDADLRRVEEGGTTHGVALRPHGTP